MSMPKRFAARVWGLAAVAMLVMLGGCGLGGAEAGTQPSGATATTSSPQAEIAAGAPARTREATTAPSRTAASSPRTSASSPGARRPSKKPTRPASSSTPSPAVEQIWDQAPECATFEGTAISKKKAKGALTAAAGRVYWPTGAPQLRLSPRLVKAVAWQESGWQSNIVNCDGGFGLMQVMPDTVAHVNQRFGEDYDVRSYRENASAGANYLAWLTRKFGDNYFGGTYDLSPRRCSDHTDMCLLNMVISGYNAGDGGVEQGHAAGELPNPAYVDSVRSLMAKCPCDRF